MKWKSDPYWVKALDAAMALSDKHIHILVPDEFINERASFWPVKQAGQLPRGGNCLRGPQGQCVAAAPLADR